MVVIPKRYDKIEREDNSGIDRDEVTVDGKDIRVYKKNNTYVPSMSTLKQFSDDGTDFSSWEDNNDGRNGNPNYKDLKEILALRGTLIHAAVHSNFIEGELFGDEEKRAVWAIENYEEHREKNMDVETEWIPENVPYFNEGEGVKEWADRTIPMIQESMMKMLSDVKRVIAIEKYIISEELGLAGQVDMVVETINGDIVPIDLKATGSINESHKQQVRGYGEVLEKEYGIPVNNYRIVRSNCRYGDRGECDSQLLEKGMNIEHQDGWDVSWTNGDEPLDEILKMSDKAKQFVDENQDEIDKQFSAEEDNQDYDVTAPQYITENPIN